MQRTRTTTAVEDLTARAAVQVSGWGWTRQRPLQVALRCWLDFFDHHLAPLSTSTTTIQRPTCRSILFCLTPSPRSIRCDGSMSRPLTRSLSHVSMPTSCCCEARDGERWQRAAKQRGVEDAPRPKVCCVAAGQLVCDTASAGTKDVSAGHVANLPCSLTPALASVAAHSRCVPAAQFPRALSRPLFLLLLLLFLAAPAHTFTHTQDRGSPRPLCGPVNPAGRLCLAVATAPPTASKQGLPDAQSRQKHVPDGSHVCCCSRQCPRAGAAVVVAVTCVLQVEDAVGCPCSSCEAVQQYWHADSAQSTSTTGVWRCCTCHSAGCDKAWQGCWLRHDTGWWVVVVCGEARGGDVA